MIKNRKAVFVLICVLGVIVFAIFGWALFREKPSQPIPSETPQVTFQRDETYNSPNRPRDGIYQTITPDGEQMLKKDALIGQLINKLPHSTNTFTLTYDFEGNKFVFSYAPELEKEANKDFDEYLKENGIENRDWLYNLTVFKL